MITIAGGLHMQYNVPGWTAAVAKLPPGAVVKWVFNAEKGREVLEANPLVRVVYRWQGAEDQPGGKDGFARDPDPEAAARRFFDHFIDGTFINQNAAYIHDIEGLNELTSHGLETSPDPKDRAKYADYTRWLTVLPLVWRRDYRERYSELAHIRLVSPNLAIGNDLGSRGWEIARSLVQNDGIAGYHSYIPTADGVPHPADWEWFSGRFARMDRDWLARGYAVDWLITEWGPIKYGVHDNGDLDLAPGVEGGWRDPAVCGGDFAKLRGVLEYWIDRAHGWNLQNGGRLKGACFFTSGNVGWDRFQLRDGDLQAFTDWARDYEPVPVLPPAPPPPSPPPPPVDNRARGIDISHHQGEFPWEAVYEATPNALHFAIVRTTYGTKKDDWVRRNSLECARLGIPYSGYHFLRSNQPAADQATACHTYFEHGGALWSLPLWVDVEEDPFDGDSVPTLDIIKAFFAAWRGKTRHPIGIYTRASIWNNIAGAAAWARAEGVPLWLAHYTTAPAPWVPDGWDNWDFWQYTSKGRLDGYDGPLDFNRFNGDIHDLNGHITVWTAYRDEQPPPGGTPFTGGSMTLWLEDGRQMSIEFGAGDIVTTNP